MGERREDFPGESYPEGIEQQAQSQQFQRAQDVSNTAGRESVPQQVQHIKDEIKDTGRELINETSQPVCETLDNVSQCLRQTAREMNEHEHPTFGKYIQSAAEDMDRFSKTIRNKDLDFVIDRTEEVARRQPGVFLGSAFTIGFAIGRYLKSKSVERSEYGGRRFEEQIVGTGGISDPEVWH